ncbi:MAG: AMP-binding protein [Thiomonas arsenitoxydans]|uniref:AMP-binding protein n=1 Tax=Thiomonas arsenitoxydans (strain DSM 22701 / CIP 110005 / 3As) TaxID=426114 RepID=A0A8I1MU79_THIA3|nr:MULTISPECIES: AMP-binding protein [Thiomonas]MBN8743234.1 AMP-binding protein [Thiomonas arsenitoxydans]ODU91402.1 MAG: AMP-dependent synthetase [Thiomonas sp. SCN 64-16]
MECHDTPYDALETRSGDQREAEFWKALRLTAAHAKANASAWADRLREIEPEELTGRDALARIPVLRKSELLALQRASCERGGDVFAGHATVGWTTQQPHRATALRVFSSPGPIYEPQGSGIDPWRMARALHAAGLRPGELLHNSFSYHFTPAGAMLEGGAHRLGCTVFPAGIGQTELQVQALADLGAHCYGGTPSFLGILVDRAQALGIALPRLTKALVSGEALNSALRERLDAANITALQCYASADVGLIAFETRERNGLLIDESVLIEILDPNNRPVPDGEVGEVVVTVLNSAYPLIRFGTGDLSSIVPESRHTPLSCGRTQLRIAGWMGRADQATKVRGLFVHPHQIQDVLKRHPEVRWARLEVSQRDGEDQMQLICVSEVASPNLAQALQQTMRDLTKLRAEVTWQSSENWLQNAPTISDLRARPSSQAQADG